MLGFCIDKYIYHTISRLQPGLFDYRVRLAYSKVETVSDVKDIGHVPFREIIRSQADKLDFEVHVCSDLPAFSGLGSSSSFSVGLINAINALNGISRSPEDLAHEAIRIERDVLSEMVGWQDQVFAAYGGINLIEFRTNGQFEVTPMPVTKSRIEELSQSALLFHTNIKRRAQDIERKKFGNFGKVKGALSEIRKMVDDAEKCLNGNGTLCELGGLLHESWLLKKSISDVVSTDAIDRFYLAGLEAGAWGGKLLGAGGGGCLLFLVPPERRDEVIKSVAPMIPIPMNIGADGSSVLSFS